MYAEERQQTILTRIQAVGRVEVAELADDLDVTTETVRRDLSRLENLGHVRRVHGGAISVQNLIAEPSVEDRVQAMVGEKTRIASAALDELPDEGAILLDAGTTTAQLATMLPRDRRLTVVTNAMDIATALSGYDNVSVLVLGGRLRRRTLATVDGWAADMLRDINVDVAFVATNGISVDRGLTTPDSDEARIKSLMVAAARRTVLLADNTKVGRDHLVRFAVLDDIDVMITDRGVGDRELDGLRSAGLEVRLA